MFRTIQALVLVAGLLGFAGQGFAQDPVTERTGNSQTKPARAAPKQAPAAAAKLLVTLEGREEGFVSGALVFYWYDDAKVVMIDATKQPVQGSIKRDANRVQFVFGNCIYEGTEPKNGTLVGTARFTSGAHAGNGWNFSVAVGSVLGRTYAGQETLPGYGAVSFRFIDATTVEMIDRDGTARGTYLQDGMRVTMTFGGTVYTGDVRGDSISGPARDTKHNWTFQVNVSK